MLASTRMPGRTDMLARLEAADPDHLTGSLHPYILKAAGLDQTGPGVALMLRLAVVDYLREAPVQPGEAAALRQVGSALGAMLPDLARALVDDPQVLADALAALPQDA